MTRWGTADRLMCALVASLTVYGCGFTPLRDTGIDEQTMTITWERGSTQRNCYFLTGQDAWACAAWQNKHNRCKIYAPEPRGIDDSEYMALLGHETLHCFKGAFH